MTIRTKLATALLAIVVLLSIPLTIALRSLQRLHDETAQLRDREFAASLLLGRIRSGVDDVRQRELALLYVYSEQSRVQMDSAVSRLAAMADSLDLVQLDSAGQRIRSAVRTLADAAPREYAAASTGDTERADSISSTEVQPALRRLDMWVGAAERSLRERTQERVSRTASRTEAATRLAGLALLVALALIAAIAVWITRTISRPVQDLDQGMRAVAGGDFGRPLAISADRRDEFGRLAASYRDMAAQLAELDKLKAEFVSVASHELKTPINVIMGYVQLLDEGMYGPVSPQQREVLRTLETQCQTLTRLVRHLLDVSRFQAGGGKLEPRPIVLGTFLEDLERSFAVLAHQRGVAFRVVPGAELPREVHWDQDRMNEVLGNLLSNAFKFTPRGGTVELAVDGEGDSVHLEVRDTGAGIPEAQLPHIFRKFYQADNQGAADTAGTGLGLAISKEIVEAHQGTIAVDSTPGIGTTFTVTMPVRISARRQTGPQRRIAGAAT